MPVDKEPTNNVSPISDKDDEQGSTMPLSEEETQAQHKMAATPKAAVTNKTFSEKPAVFDTQDIFVDAEAWFLQPSYRLTGEEFRILTSSTFQSELLLTLTRGAFGAFFAILILIIVKSILSIQNNEPINLLQIEKISFWVSICLALLFFVLNKLIPNDKKRVTRKIKSFFEANPGVHQIQRKQK